MAPSYHFVTFTQVCILHTARDYIFFDLPGERGASTQAHLSDRGRGHKAVVSQFNHERIHANPGVEKYLSFS